MKTFLLFFLISTNVFAISEIHCPGPRRDMMVADPAIVEQNDSILVMGTGDVLKYKNIHALINGESPKKENLILFKEVSVGENKVILQMTPQELPWDLQIYEMNGVKYLYGGVMSPLPGLVEARWPEENISRRIKVATFDNKLKGWVFKESPVFGDINHHS